jgi:hypothetical protein
MPVAKRQGERALTSIFIKAIQIAVDPEIPGLA